MLLLLLLKQQLLLLLLLLPDQARAGRERLVQERARLAVRARQILRRPRVLQYLRRALVTGRGGGRGRGGLGYCGLVRRSFGRDGEGGVAVLGGLAAAVPRVVLVVAVLLLSAGPIGCAATAAARGEGQLRGGVGQLQQVRLLLLLLLLPVSPVGVVVARVVGLVEGPPASAAAGGAPEAAAAAAAVAPSASVRGVAAPGVGLSLRPSARGFAAGPPVHGGEVLRFPKGSPPKEFQHFCGASASVARSQGAPFPPFPSLFSLALDPLAGPFLPPPPPTLRSVGTGEGR